MKLHGQILKPNCMKNVNVCIQASENAYVPVRNFDINGRYRDSKRNLTLKKRFNIFYDINLFLHLSLV